MRRFSDRYDGSDEIDGALDKEVANEVANYHKSYGTFLKELADERGEGLYATLSFLRERLANLQSKATTTERLKRVEAARDSI